MREISMAGPATCTCIAMASEEEAVCLSEGVVRVHHIYKAMWTLTVREILARTNHVP